MNGMRAVVLVGMMVGCSQLTSAADLKVSADAGAPPDDDAGQETPKDASSTPTPDASRPTYASVVLADAPVAYWQLEETTSSQGAHDSSGQGHDGVFEGGVTLAQPGIVSGGNSARFDGTSARVRVGDVLPFSGLAPFSLEAWVRPVTVDARYQLIISKLGPNAATPYFLDVQSPSGVQFGRAADLCKTQQAIGLDAFTHVLATFDGVTSKIYINGSLATSLDGAHSMSTTTSALQIGGAQDGTSTPNTGTWFEGLIDEVAVYDKALPPERVAAHYQAGTSR